MKRTLYFEEYDPTKQGIEYNGTHAYKDRIYDSELNQSFVVYSVPEGITIKPDAVYVLKAVSENLMNFDGDGMGEVKLWKKLPNGDMVFGYWDIEADCWYKDEHETPDPEENLKRYRQSGYKVMSINDYNG